ncbi:MAG TPA: cytochrome b/b6 domain-containing protein [Actinomycetota bacterium]|nr:cytochrome b/b6 domain-containing protein [Actinomycetota bacterium]
MGPATEPIRRHGRVGRWFHAAVYLTVLPLMATGWWLIVGREGQQSPLARLAGMSDAHLHRLLGWALAGATLAGLALGARGIPGALRETFRRDRGDGRWLLRWPRAAFTGRFARHEGEFDPGQRIANVVIAAGLLILIGTGIGLATLHGGHLFAVLAKVHKWTAIAITPVLLGHILIATGVLPGYRGVWRSMHLGGRVRLGTARRLWPGWTERQRPTDLEPPATLHTKVDRALADEWADHDQPA